MNALARQLAARIARDGPLTIEDFMTACLLDIKHGYYTTRDPFGAPGDFVTAPEISQMFGELIGLWLWSLWNDGGARDSAYLVELGPGRGTLMADALRAMTNATRAPVPFDVHLVEAGPALRERQADTLKGHDVRWHETLDTLPTDGPVYLVANEFFDALPIRQFVATQQGWRERLIGCADGKLTPVLAPEEAVTDIPPAPLGHVAEMAPQRMEAVSNIAQRVAQQGGAALIVDFADPALPLADTLQAVRAHRYADRLEEPGEADLASAVDFTALACAAQAAGSAVFGPVGQGQLMRSLGIEARCEALAANAREDQAKALKTAMDRLVSPDGMGEDFRAMALLPREHSTPLGFASPSP